MQARCHYRWALLVWMLVLVPPGRAAGGIDKLIRIQPIQVCSDDGTVCGNVNRVLFEAETKKVWRQAGMEVEFLPWRTFPGTAWLDLSVSVFADYTIYTLASTPGHEQNPDPRVINVWFVRSFSNGAFGHSWQTDPGGMERNGIGVADNAFSFNGGLGRVDVIAHELGHNLGLDHSTFGAGAADNLMSSDRQVPATAADIAPDGAGLDFLTAGQVGQARSNSFAVEPLILQHPTNQTAKAGSDVAFTVVAGGTTALRYRWWFDRTNRLGWATNATLTLTNVQVAQGGTFQVVVSNLSGVVTSRVATLIIDSDEDGMPDVWEAAQGFDPHSGADALLDSDGDGLSNLEEYVAGTDPHDPRSVLRAAVLAVPSKSNAVASIAFQAMSGKRYTAQYRDRLERGGWQTLTNLPPATADGRLTIIDPFAGGQPQRFYRVVIPPQP